MIRLSTCPQCHRSTQQIPAGLATVLVCSECSATWFSAPPEPSPDPEPEPQQRVRAIAKPDTTAPPSPTELFLIGQTIRGERPATSSLLP